VTCDFQRRQTLRRVNCRMSRSAFLYCWWITEAMGGHPNCTLTILTSNRFKVCRQLSSSCTLRLCEAGLHTTFRISIGQLLNTDAKFSSSIFSLWPMWLWPIWSVADMVQTPSSHPHCKTRGWPLIWYYALWLGSFQLLHGKAVAIYFVPLSLP